MPVTEFQRLSAALLEATGEHGLPNSFSPGWLAMMHGAPRPFRIGALLRNSSHFWALRKAAAEAEEPFSFQYVKGARGEESRFVVTPLSTTPPTHQETPNG